MKITVYVPDHLGQRAKAANINFSRLLRGALEVELDRILAKDLGPKKQDSTTTTERQDLT